MDFSRKYNLTDWNSVFSNIANEYRFIIAEDEIHENIDNPSFILGEVVDIGKKCVKIHGLTGTARWHKKPTKISFKNISSFQADNNYAKTYERYFKKNALTRPSSGCSR